ncbi:MAG: hypothetical protein V7K54_30935 [Nostoc sp.]
MNSKQIFAMPVVVTELVVRAASRREVWATPTRSDFAETAKGLL